MQILALQPYHGGSHKAFLDGWRSHSAHNWTCLTLPARHWRWRMRHAPLTFAEQLRDAHSDRRWDLIFTTSMLSLSEFIGLAPRHLAEIPTVVYFHENQLTYPLSEGLPRDNHLCYSQFLTALCADQLWFNSQYHLDAFTTASRVFLRGMPDFKQHAAVDAIAQKAVVQHPGITPIQTQPRREALPLKIAWAARWEEEKDPETFFNAIDQLQALGIPFQLSVMGGHEGRSVPQCFECAKSRFREQIVAWGHLSPDEYRAALGRADVIVSTARHEFFGITIAEAASAGCVPLVPDALAYPELLKLLPTDRKALCFHDGTSRDIAERLQRISQLIEQDNIGIEALREQCADAVEPFQWCTRAKEMDEALR